MNKNECVKNQYFTALLALEQDKVHGIRELSSLSLFRGLDFVMMMMMMMMRNLPGKRGKRREDFVPTFWSGTGRNIPPYVKVDCGEGGGGTTASPSFFQSGVSLWLLLCGGGKSIIGAHSTLEGRGRGETPPLLIHAFKHASEIFFCGGRRGWREGGERKMNYFFQRRPRGRHVPPPPPLPMYFFLAGTDEVCSPFIKMSSTSKKKKKRKKNHEWSSRSLSDSDLF